MVTEISVYRSLQRKYCLYQKSIHYNEGGSQIASFFANRTLESCPDAHAALWSHVVQVKLAQASGPGGECCFVSVNHSDSILLANKWLRRWHMTSLVNETCREILGRTEILVKGLKLFEKDPREEKQQTKTKTGPRKRETFFFDLLCERCNVYRSSCSLAILRTASWQVVDGKVDRKKKKNPRCDCEDTELTNNRDNPTPAPSRDILPCKRIDSLVV